MSAEPGTATLDRIAAAHRAVRQRLRGGPLWTDRRERALARLVERGLPDRRDENWKYLDWPELERRSFELPQQVRLSATHLAAARLPLEDAALVVLVDGRYSAPLSGGVLPAGLTVTGLAELSERDPERLAGLLPAPGDDVDQRFELLAEAFADDGVLIEIAPGAEVATPVYLVHACSCQTAATTHTRVLVEAGARSRARIVEHFVSLSDQDSLANLAARIRLGDGARLEHVRIHEQGPAAVLVETLGVSQQRDSHYRHQGFTLGGRIVRSNLRLRLEGPGAENILHGLFMADGTRQADLFTLIEHMAPRTRTDELYRGVATDRGRGAFNGKIVVHEGAAGADSRQSSRNLILSPLAEINARPQLEILTDDVKCSHGATTGSLDPNQLFYLLSRGIDPDTARGLLTFAFCEDVISRVELPVVRRHVEELVVGRLPDRDVIREFV